MSDPFSGLYHAVELEAMYTLSTHVLFIRSGLVIKDTRAEREAWLTCLQEACLMGRLGGLLQMWTDAAIDLRPG